MARITETIESSLRGNTLRSRTMDAVLRLMSRMPYSAARATARWNEQRNLVIESPQSLVTGNVRFTDGSPSSVRIQLDVDNGSLRLISGGAERVRQDIREAAAGISNDGGGARERASATTVLDTVSAIMAGITQGLTPADTQAAEVETAVARDVAEDQGAPAPSMRPANIGGAKGDAIRRYQEQRARGKSAQSLISWGWIAGAAAVVTGGTALVLWVTRDKESF